MSRTNKSMALVLILVLMIATIIDLGDIYADGGARRAPRDVTDDVVISGITLKGLGADPREIIIKDGVETGTNFEIKVGYTLKLSFKWEVKENVPLVADDFFKVNLANPEYLKLKNDFTNVPVKLKGSSEVIGTANTLDNVLTVTINEKGTHNRLVDGEFECFLKVVKAGTDIGLPIGNSLSITVVPSTSGGGPSTPQIIGTGEDNCPKLTKSGKNDLHGADDDKIVWDIYANVDQLKQLMAGTAIEPRNNLYIEDKIHKNMTLLEDGITMRALIKIPLNTDTTKVSTSQPDSLRGMIDMPPIVKPTAGEGYDAFKARILQQNTPMCGIYPLAGDTNYSSILIAAWGNSPGTKKNGIDKPLTYYDLTGGKTAFENKVNTLQTNGEITSGQSDKMKAVYGTSDDTGVPVVGFRLQFKTKVTEKGSYPNTATMYWDTNKSEEQSAEAEYRGQSISAGQSSMDLTVKKIWKDVNDSDLATGKQPDSIEVKLLRKGLDGTFAEILGKKLTLKKSEGWTKKFENLDKYYAGEISEYKVEEVPIAGYEQVGIKKTSAPLGFEITNKKSIEKISIPVKKVWKNSDGTALDESSQPLEIKVKLTKKNAVSGIFEEIPGKELTLKKSDGWEGKFIDLDKTDLNGVELEYGIKEEVIDGYNVETVKDSSGKYIIANTKKPKKPHKPKPPTPPTPTPPPDKPPVTPPTPPSEPPVTPPTPPNNPPAVPPETPKYPPSNPPDPNDPNSPPEIEIIGDDGVPLGKYKKVPKPGGGFEYIDEEGIPLGNMKLVGTGNDFPEMGLIAVAGMSILGIALVLEGRRRRMQ